MQSDIRQDTLFISGDVTVKTLTDAAYARFQQQCRLKEIVRIDFSGVGRADSACVSLLLTALRLKPQAVSFANVPESVQALADLYELKDWLKP